MRLDSHLSQGRFQPNKFHARQEALYCGPCLVIETVV